MTRLSSDVPAVLDTGNVLGRATKELLLITAERLFAQRGLEAVPLRDIGLEAGQRNNGVMQYHFGDRETVIRSIYDLRARYIHRRRMELLDELEASGRVDDPASLLRVIIQPHTDGLRDPDNYFIGFLHRLAVERGVFIAVPEGVEESPYSRSFARAWGYLALCLGTEVDVTKDRVRIIFGWAMHSLSAYMKPGATPRHELDVDRILDDLVIMLVPAMLSPLPVARA